jgi:DNA ligase (NAD+)
VARGQEKAGGGLAGPLAGKRFLFTGELPDMPRQKAQELVEAAGGTGRFRGVEETRLSGGGGQARSKLAKAREHGVAVIGREAFLELLRSGPGRTGMVQASLLESGDPQ